MIEDDNAIMCEWLQKEVLFIGKEIINFNIEQNKIDHLRKYLHVQGGACGSVSDKTSWKSNFEFDDISPGTTPSRRIKYFGEGTEQQKFNFARNSQFQ